MGTDNLFHKRRERKKTDLKRRQARRDPLDVVLIVCEGEKTEPIYLADLRDALGLNRANVVISGDCGSSPNAVVEEAITRFERELDYDRVYCVFDRDQHESYESASDRVRTKTLHRPGRGAEPVIFRAITSVPCFEYWILLHYGYETRPFQVTQRRSPCESVIDRLKRVLPDYEKALHGVYERTSSRLDQAIENAKRALAAAHQAGTDNPSTHMHELVEELRELATKKYEQAH